MTANNSASAIAHPNIAFIKYWGNRDEALRIPSNGSISMNLDGLETRTTVEFNPSLSKDALFLNGKKSGVLATERVTALLDRVRSLASITTRARVTSENNFPTGSGIASSASAFAALAIAASAAAGLELDESALSRLARTGSGSASRSVPAGFVEWLPGKSDANSYALSIAPPNHWDLLDLIVIVSQGHKKTGSTGGHRLASTSPLQTARISAAPARLEECRRALLARDFSALAHIVELDSNIMHAVMMTSTPPLFYWKPATLAVIERVTALRAAGLDVCYTIDAGPNVHVITTGASAKRARRELLQVSGVIEVLTARPGGPARIAP
ncbi:MAG: diphosphomevalonate decarboxylase [Anaerolineae bacterium]|nr:MAG: diphosphomevalonate decarboxylase [Anaerolineae bacterium]